MVLGAAVYVTISCVVVVGAKMHHGERYQNEEYARYNFSYEPIADVASIVYKVVEHSNREYGKMHAHQMMNSPTSRAIQEYMNKVFKVKNFGGDECLANGVEEASKDFKKRHVTVVYDCEAGWQTDTDLASKTQATLKTLIDLDDQAKEELAKCKLGKYCIYQFKKSTLGQSINTQLSKMKQDVLVDIQVKGDFAHLRSLQSVSKCNADGTDDLRKDIYSAMANLQICAAKIGIMMEL